jgi:hypothetical protein
MKRLQLLPLLVALLLGPLFGFAQVVIKYEGTESKQFSITGKAGSTAVFYDATENTLVAKAGGLPAGTLLSQPPHARASPPTTEYWRSGPLHRGLPGVKWFVALRKNVDFSLTGLCAA